MFRSIKFLAFIFISVIFFTRLAEANEPYATITVLELKQIQTRKFKGHYLTLFQKIAGAGRDLCMIGELSIGCSKNIIVNGSRVYRSIFFAESPKQVGKFAYIRLLIKDYDYSGRDAKLVTDPDAYSEQFFKLADVLFIDALDINPVEIK